MSKKVEEGSQLLSVMEHLHKFPNPCKKGHSMPYLPLGSEWEIYFTKVTKWKEDHEKLFAKKVSRIQEEIEKALQGEIIVVRATCQGEEFQEKIIYHLTNLVLKLKPKAKALLVSPEKKLEEAQKHHKKHGDMNGHTCLLNECTIHYPKRKLEGSKEKKK